MRGAGLNIPVFSLRSKKSVGCGEFLDLILLIDWAKEAGLKLIQILPINDTIEGDNYPYSILSAFALHPIYINLQALAPELEEEIRPVARELNLPDFDYGRTNYAKKEFLKLIYLFRGEKDLATKSFEAFFEKHKDDLKTYAAFCALRDKFGTSDFRKWGKYKTYSEVLVDEVCEDHPVQFFYFVQYHLHKQIKQVVSHAKKQGILLKGDFPMGVLENSVEAWRFYEYFRWDKSMGAPPDFYNSLGQNWGFPPYDWNEIKEEGFFWLKSRLKWLDQYFDVIRLDHVLGYFRLWEVPIDEVRGLMGNFYPAKGFSEEELKEAGLNIKKEKFESQKKVLQTVKDEKEREKQFEQIENRLFFHREGSFHPRIDVKSTAVFQELSDVEQEIMLRLFNEYYLEQQEKLWQQKGLEKLKFMQKNTSMLVCAEDIGVIPNCVEKVLKELKMLNLHVQRMPKSFEIEYEDPKDFPEMCVCTPSNHDTATLREWWEENYDSTTRYYHTILKHEGNPPEKLTEKLAQEIIQAHLDSKARWAIFLLQDLLATSDELKFPHPEKERINDPAIPNFKWNWRMHLYMEELQLAQSFTDKIYEMVKEAKR